VNTRCLACATSRRACSHVKLASPSKQDDQQNSADEPDDGVEIVDAPKSKGKKILGAISKSFKRKQSDRSPEASITVSKKPSRSPMVCVELPPSPCTHCYDHQFDSRTSVSSLDTSSMNMVGAMGPPLSATPSIASFDTRFSTPSTPTRNYVAEHYRALYESSQEDLINQRRQHENEILNIQARNAAKERNLLAIAQEEREYYESLLRAPPKQDDRGEGSSGQGRGSGGSHRR
jgi:hypothetical protein